MYTWYLLEFFYAIDDIVLLAPSVNALQQMLTLCEDHLAYLDMTLNVKKSVCMRIGKRHKDDCCPLITANGENLCWVESCRYLGVYIVAAKSFKCSITSNKHSYYRCFNAIYSKVGHCASEEVVIKLITTKCLPILLYGLDACPVSTTDKHSLDFVLNRTFMKLFRTSSIEIVSICQLMFGFKKISETVIDRKRRFLQRYTNCDNIICQTFVNAANVELILCGPQ